MKRFNVGLFVPHEGCPNQCSFCNQKSISGKTKKLTADDVDNAVKRAIETAGDIKGEIAFFGGSFTAIEREYMLELLETAYKYMKYDCFDGIRISTRPDKIDEEICCILKKYGVTAVELGCQSMDDEVLLKNNRGHNVEDIEKSAKMLKSFGFETGLQMMTGLYGSSYEKDIETAKKIIALHPDTVRIYPTVVLENTPLCELYRSGKYIPMSLDETVSLCGELIEMFEKKKIKIIRVGLHSGGNLEEGYVTGAYHPAFKELCESEIYLKKIKEILKEKNIKGGEIVINVNTKSLSPALGHKKKNALYLREAGYIPKFCGAEDVKKYDVRIDFREEEVE